MGVMRDGHARRADCAFSTASVQRCDAPALLVKGAPHGGQQVRADPDHDTYAKAQDCAHFQPEGQ